MAKVEIGDVTVEAPPGFEVDESMLSLRAAAGKGAKPPAAGAPAGPPPAETSLVLHAKRARPDADVEVLAGEMVAELAQALGGMKNLTTVAFTFDDGNAGVLVAYDFPVPGRELLRQYHALRLDGPRLTSLTLTVPAANLTPQLADTYLKTLASARKGG